MPIYKKALRGEPVHLARVYCVVGAQKLCLMSVTYSLGPHRNVSSTHQHLAKWSGKAKINIPTKTHYSKISTDSKMEHAKTEEDYMALVLAAEKPPGLLSGQEDISHPTCKCSGPRAIIHQLLAAMFPYAVWWLYWGWSLKSGVRKFSSVIINSISSSWKSALSTQGSQSALCPCHMYIFACSLAM